LGIGDWGLGPIPNPPSPIPLVNDILIKLNHLNQSLNQLNQLN